jgi:hypothetical protein
MTHCRRKVSLVLSQPEVTHADLTEICHGEPQGARMIPHAYLSNTEQLSRERDAIVKIGTYLDGAKRMARKVAPQDSRVQRLFRASTKNPDYRDMK